MMQLKPVIKIKAQSQISKPTNSDSTIMDDTVMLMDGTALMGGPTQTQTITRLKAKILKPNPQIKIKH